MKHLIYMAVILLGSQQLRAQSLTESKDNMNSILLNGSAVTLNITDPSLRLDFQRNQLFKGNRNNGYLFGISAEGRNGNGIAAVFNGGDLVPSGRVVGIAGLTFTNNTNVFTQEILKSLNDEDAALIRKILRDSVILKNLMKAGENTSKIIRVLYEENKERRSILTERSRLADKMTENAFYKLSFFLFGGTMAKSFKHFIGYNPADLYRSFKNENFRGGFYGAGVNYQYRNWQLGTTIVQTSDDNQYMLAEKTYNYEKVTTVNNQTIKEAKEIKAYAGEYAAVSYLSLNADVIANISLNKISSMEQPRNYMLINPYLHSKINSSNRDLLPNTTDIGLGLYVFDRKSKFLGGIYIELPDVSDKIEKSKIAADRSIRPALQKLSFGIVTRFNFESFMNFQNL